jgi:hypothetical protein
MTHGRLTANGNVESRYNKLFFTSLHVPRQTDHSTEPLQPLFYTEPPILNKSMVQMGSLGSRGLMADAKRSAGNAHEAHR